MAYPQFDVRERGPIKKVPVRYSKSGVPLVKEKE
jgi:hypothetical protein